MKKRRDKGKMEKKQEEILEENVNAEEETAANEPEAEAAAEAPAKPVPMTMMSSLRLLAGLTSFCSALYFVHFSAKGPVGIFEFNSMISKRLTSNKLRLGRTIAL